MPSSKTFNGKRYERVASYTTRKEAQAAANKSRELGNLARISLYTTRFGKKFYLLYVKY